MKYSSSIDTEEVLNIIHIDDIVEYAIENGDIEAILSTIDFDVIEDYYNKNA